MYASIHSQKLASEDGVLEECAKAFAPTVERTDGQTVVFNIDGLGLLYSSVEEILSAIRNRIEAAGLPANIAIARNPDTAVLAARYLPGTNILSDTTVDSLDRLKVKALPLTPEIEEAFELWGVRTLEDLAQLPLAETVARLGDNVIGPHRMAQHAINRPLILDRPKEIFEDRVEFEEPIQLLEPLLFVLGRSLGTLCDKLQSFGVAAAGFDLILELEDKTVFDRSRRFPVPFDRSRTLLKLIQLDLSAHPPPAAIKALELKLIPALPRRIQEGLLTPLSPEPDKLEVTLARIRALVGEQNLGAPILLNTHRPDGISLIPFEVRQQRRRAPSSSAPRKLRVAFRYFRPPLETEVTTLRNQPARVRARGLQEKVITASGPWRSSGDWWTGEPWDRDEWDVLLQNGTLCRLCRGSDQRWVIEGVYD